MKFQLILIIVFIFSNNAISQNNGSLNTSIGFNFYIPTKKNNISGKYEFKCALNLGASIGYKYRKDDNGLKYIGQPSLAAQYIFLWNTHGTSIEKRSHSEIHIAPVLALTPRIRNHQNWDNSITMPLNVFHGFSNTPLFNSELGGVIVSTNFIFYPKKHAGSKELKDSQMVAYIGFKYKYFLLEYSNDGGPVLKYYADKKDRWWTGGLRLTYADKQHIIKGEYDVFTGYQKKAFESSNLMNLGQMPYETSQVNYNKGRLGFSYINRKIGVGLELNIHGGNMIGLQNGLHRALREAKHPIVDRSIYIDFGLLYEQDLYNYNLRN